MTAIQQWWFGGTLRQVRKNYAQVVAEDAPLVWWKMDEASGTLGTDSGTLGLDFTLDTTQGAFGAGGLWSVGNCLDCSVDGRNRGIAPANAAMHFPGGFTFSALVNWTPSSAPGRIISHAEANVNQGDWQFFISADGHPTIQLGSGNTSGEQSFFVATAATLTPGTTYLVAARWDAGTGAVSLWLDGEQVFSGNWPHALYDTVSRVGVSCLPYSMGGGSTIGTYCGLLDEVLMFDRPLSDDRMRAHWNAIDFPTHDSAGLREDGGYELREDGGFELRD